MTLFMIGIGLWDEKDITVKGLEAVKKCSKVFLEVYTSKLGITIEKLERFYGKEIVLADRELVEKNSDEMLENAKLHDVAFLVIGDVFGATTHTDLYLRALSKGITVQVINNASVLNAIGIVGLELYKFGKTSSIPFHNNDVTTPYDVLKKNKEMGMHTLLLLDIHADKGRFMTVNEAVKYLLDVERKKQEKVFGEHTTCIGVARLGSLNPCIKTGTARELESFDFGGPLHCLIVPGNLHFIEEEAIAHWK